MKELKITVYCDRCNKKITEEDVPVKSVEVVKAGGDEDKSNPIELCDECYTSFTKWLESYCCHLCEYYEGVHGVMGVAPCVFGETKMTMWNATCQNFNEYKKE